ncbi:MAG: hypothetical protein IPH84_19690 [Bacteroidales bacterium]|nr:hypothetical protein [Bacteroidales bacterium]
MTLFTLNEQGCSDTTSILYTLLFKALCPQCFCPGRYSTADKDMEAVGQNLTTYHCQVYNSHGALIWESKQLDERITGGVLGWNLQGHPVQRDVCLEKSRPSSAMAPSGIIRM